jgi:hypothetical protein
VPVSLWSLLLTTNVTSRTGAIHPLCNALTVSAGCLEMFKGNSFIVLENLPRPVSFQIFSLFVIHEHFNIVFDCT